MPGNFQRKKTFVVLWLFATVFSVKFGSMTSLAAPMNNLGKFSSAKVSCKSLSLYGS